MIEALYVPKSYGTYSDTCLMLGLACLAEYALGATGQKQGMQLIDEGTCYRIQFNKPMDLSKIESVSYFNLFQPIVGAKTFTDDLPPETTCFNAVENIKSLRLYQNWRRQNHCKWSEDAPNIPDSRTLNGRLFTTLGINETNKKGSPKKDNKHNKIWLEGWNNKYFFGQLLQNIFEEFSENYFASINTSCENVSKSFSKIANEISRIIYSNIYLNLCESIDLNIYCYLANLILQKKPKNKIENLSTNKLYSPTTTLGVKHYKANSIKPKPTNYSWIILWLIAKGLFDFSLSGSVKVGDDDYDWRVVVLEPKNISLSHYRSILNDLRKLNPPGSGYGIARFDAELVLKFSQEMLNLSCQTSRKPKLVGNFRGSHFGPKGKVYGLKDIFSLGLPDWIKVSPNETKKAIALHKVLAEHLSVVRSLNENQTEILAAYRDFITGKELELFFPFQVRYAEYAIKQLADPKANNPYLFSTEGLNTMVRNFKDKTEEQDWSIDEIIKNPGFLRIAKAINQATVYAGKIQTKDGIKELDWQRNYGLAQRLSSHADSEKDFLRELTSFLISYENENVRLTEKLQKEGKKLYRVWTNKEDLDQVFSLIKDKRFGSSLVANLLVAYGYAKWSKKSSYEKPEDEFEITEETNTKK